MDEDRLPADQAGKKDQAPEEEISPETPPADTAALKAELEKTRAALKAANAESAARRKKLETYERSESRSKSGVDEAFDEELARLKGELAAARTEAEQAQATARATAIRHAVETAAAALHFQDPADALTLADLTAVQVDDKGAVSGAAEAVKALADKRPYLLKLAGDALGTPRRTPAPVPYASGGQKPPAESQKPGAPLVRL